MKIKVLTPPDPPIQNFEVEFPEELLPLIEEGDEFVASEVRQERWGHFNPSYTAIQIRRRCNADFSQGREGDVGEIILYSHNREEIMMKAWKATCQKIADEINRRVREFEKNWKG